MDSRQLIVACLEAANRNEMDVAAALVHADFVGVVPANGAGRVAALLRAGFR